MLAYRNLTLLLNVSKVPSLSKEDTSKASQPFLLSQHTDCTLYCIVVPIQRMWEGDDLYNCKDKYWKSSNIFLLVHKVAGKQLVMQRYIDRSVSYGKPYCNYWTFTFIWQSGF